MLHARGTRASVFERFRSVPLTQTNNHAFLHSTSVLRANFIPGFRPPFHPPEQAYVIKMRPRDRFLASRMRARDRALLRCHKVTRKRREPLVTSFERPSPLTSWRWSLTVVILLGMSSIPLERASDLRRDGGCRRDVGALHLETVLVRHIREADLLAVRCRVRVRALRDHRRFVAHRFRLARFLMADSVARLEAAAWQ